MLLNDYQKHCLHETRRQFLGKAMRGLGSVALASLLGRSLGAAEKAKTGTVALPTHVVPKAKRVIFLYMAGGPSHLESFDPKPKLAELHDKPFPSSITSGQPIAQLQGKELKCFAPQFKFNRHGRSGQIISDAFPHMGTIADDICIIRSMVTEQINHDPAHTFMNTGTGIPGRPSIGSWLNYGLGSECDDLPGFVVLTSQGGGQGQPIASRQWHSGFLPSKHQGVQFQRQGDPVLYVSQPPGVSLREQRDVVEAVKKLNRRKMEYYEDPEISTRISQYEMAFRMHSSVPELVDLSDESEATLDLYGPDARTPGTFAANCLLARRLAERDVRFIQLYHRGWDHHNNLKRDMTTSSRLVDQPSAALIKDLKQRGLLEDTLVIWGGEFGRTPMAQGTGRDHHIKGFSLWMAGGGVKGGITHGETDEFGYNAVKDVVHVHDFHATMLHLLGIDHKKLTFKFQGRQFRLTDVHGHVVKDILA